MKNTGVEGPITTMARLTTSNQVPRNRAERMPMVSEMMIATRVAVATSVNVAGSPSMISELTGTW